MRRLILLMAIAAPAFPADFSAQNVRAHVTFLADDILEGRNTATPGHEIAARYVAAQFEAYGLKPGGNNGWYQRVNFQRTGRVAGTSFVTISGPAGEQAWAHATDVMVGLNPNELELDVSAPMVFAGYGIENKRFGFDDYRGLDVKGKVVVILRGFPKGVPSEEGAYLSANKVEVAERLGAIGMVSIDTPQSAQVAPWKVRMDRAHEPDFDWVRNDGTTFQDAPGVRARAVLNTPAAQAVFAGAPRSLEVLRAEADRVGGRPKGFALKTRVRIQSKGVASRLSSPNVVAVLPGSDPGLANEYIVLSAHLDHLAPFPERPGDPPDTDRINNGALDNAAGIATMLEVARAAAASPAKPRRSLLFLATTAEEEGLQGADFFARHPTVSGRIVGNVDLDMPLLLYPFTDVIAFGANHSTIGPAVEAAAKPMGIALGPDPFPEQGLFTRSDHYQFVKQGVPAVFLATGFANGGEKHWKAFLAGQYHRPGDDLRQPIDWEAGARFAEVNYRITRAMADSDTPPLWNEGDFFGDTFAPDAPRAKPPARASQ